MVPRLLALSLKMKLSSLMVRQNQQIMSPDARILIKKVSNAPGTN